MEFKDKKVINGTWGECWVDGEYIGEIESFKVDVEMTYTDVQMTGHLEPGKKLTKIEPKGSMKCHKVRDRLEIAIMDALAAGRTPEFQIIGKVADPDADGQTRVQCDNCKFDKATLMDFEGGKNSETSYNFTCDMPKFLDAIDE